MSKTTARWINYDVQSLTGTSTLTVYLKPTGGLTKDADGISVATSGITNDMLAGSIGLDKLVKAVIAADGSQDFTADQSMGGNKLTNLGNGTAQTDAVTLSQLQSSMAGLDFQADVLDTQTDATLDPGAPSSGDRYIITDSTSLHTNFGTITGIGDGDIVEYDGTDFVVAYDVSAQGEGALVWDQAADSFKYWDGSVWDLFGGLAGVTAGDGLEKTSNTLSVKVSDIAGTGLEGDGANNLQVTAQGNGIAGGGGSLLSVDPDSTTGGDVTPVSVGANGVGVDVTALDGDHLTVDFTPSNYTPDDSPAEANDADDLAAHLKGIDSALTSAGSGSRKTVYKELDATIISNGLFTLSFNPEAADLVSLTPVGGPQQINKQSVGSTGITPDFDVLNTNEVHVNNNGSASGLSEVFQAGDVVMIEYSAA